MAKRIEINRIKIHGFKSLKEIGFEMRPLNVLIGPNNGGKSTFLEFFEFLSKAAHEELQNVMAKGGGFLSLLFAGYADSESEESKKISWEIDFTALPGSKQEKSFSYKVTLAPSFPFFRKTQVVAEWLNERNLREEKRTVASLPPPPSKGLFLGKPEAELEEGELIVAQAPKELIERFSRDYMRSWAIYKFSTENVPFCSPLRGEQSLKAGVKISPDGGNLASVLLNMREQGKYRDAYNEIIKTLRVAFPTFKDLHFPCEVSEGRITLRWEGSEFKREFPMHVLSDGILKFLCLTTLLLSPDPPDLILIDEPEIGLHPGLIDLVREMLVAASERTQLIVATHSPQLVTRLKPEDIVVVEKEDGATVFKRVPQRLTPEELESWLKDFTLAELWLTGVIGGR